MRKAPTAGSAAKATAATLPTAPRGAATAKGRTFNGPPEAPGLSQDKLMAQFAAGGIVGNARSLVAFAHGTFGELSLTDCAKVLKDMAQGLNDGDLSAAVTMLSSQAVALNAMFGELARRAALNMGEHLDATERYMRLALKAQGQCRATLESLAAIKNPPVVFARQANINNGGQQQVNNAAPQDGSATTAGEPLAHASKSLSRPNELLEDMRHGSTQLDPRATTAASKANQGLEPMGVRNRSANR